MVFGALLSPAFFGRVGWAGWVFALLALARLDGSVVALIPRYQDGLAGAGCRAWFGPKGFASVTVYGLLVLTSGHRAAERVFDLVDLTIVVSIVLHSSTDILVAGPSTSPDSRVASAPEWIVRRRLSAPHPNQRRG